MIATVSGSTTPVEIRKIAHRASMYEWQRGPPQHSPALWKLYSQFIGKLRPRRDN